MCRGANEFYSKYKIILDTGKMFAYTCNVIFVNPITVNRNLKAAWHINAVAEEVFY